AGDAAVFAGKAAWLNAQVSFVNVLETAWESDYKQGNVKAFFQTVQGKNEADFAKAFGVTPQQLAKSFAKAYEFFNFVMEDGPTKTLLLQFAKDYAFAQSKAEVAQMSGQAAFDIILGAILAFFTGGAGNAAQATAKVKHLGQFRTLAGQLIKLVGKLKRSKAKKVVKGTLDSSVKHTVTPPPKNPLKPKKNTGQTHKTKKEQKYDKTKDDKKTSTEQTSNSQNTKSKSDGTTGDTAASKSGPGTNQTGQKTPDKDNVCTSGCPISLVTGEELLFLTDFELTGPLSLPFERGYTSSSRLNQGMGVGWCHSLLQSISIGHNSWVLLNGEGRLIEFNQPELFASSLNSVEELTLTWPSENTLTLSASTPNAPLVYEFTRLPGRSQFYLSAIKDAYNNGFKLHYHEGQLHQVHSSGGDHWQFIYQQDLLTEIHQHSAGTTRSLVRYAYSAEQDLIQAFNAQGHSERYRYQNHLIQQRTLKSGYSFHFTWDGTGPSARCLRNWGDAIDGQPTYDYHFAWDKPNRRAAVTDTRGGVTHYQFNENGLPTHIKSPEGVLTRYQYDEQGRLLRTLLPGGEQESFQRDSQGLLQLYTNPAGERYQWSHTPQGQVEQFNDPNGATWRYQYNGQGQLVQTINPLGQSTHYQYNELGFINRLTNAEGHSWHYLWNGKGELTAVRNPQGQHTRYTYNPQGQVEQITWPDNQTSQYRYTPQGQLAEHTSPDGAKASWAYSALGLVTQTTDSAGLTTQYSYDGLSQVTKRTNPNGQTLHYHYDGERNLIGLTNEKGERYQLNYDLDERLIEEIGFDGRHQRYLYSPAGHLHEAQELHQGQLINRTQYQRDGLGRLLQQNSQGNSRAADYCTYKYDPAGRLIQAQNPHRTLRWQHNAIGQVVEDWQDNQRLSHQYTPAGQRSQTTLPGGEVINYAYTPEGQLHHLHYQNQLIAQIERDAAGRELTRSHGNQLNTQYRYDPQGRLTAQRTGKQQSGGGFNALSQRRYSYTSQGNLAQIDDQLRGSTRYHYDATQRLTQVQGPNPEVFIHDPAGNLLANTTAPISENQKAPGNRLNLFGDAHFHYDTSGNRTQQTRGKQGTLKTHYQYNSLNQLTAIAVNGVITQYAYDPLGRRISKRSEGKSVEFLWLGDQLLSERCLINDAVAEGVSKTYLFKPNSFEPIAFVQNASIYYYHLDHLGTPQEITNQQGELVWAVSYKAYGNLAVAFKMEVENNLRFAGQYFDEESGLHYNRFRYYDPACGRFINQDPIGLLGGVNNYLYVPNPTGWVDPLGLAAKPGDCHKTDNATKGLADPKTIRFTQDSIKSTFKDGRSLRGLIDDLKSGNVTANDLPAIRTFERDGKLYSLDNRRLKAFQEAGVPIRTRPATADEIANEAFKFTSKNDGASIRVRGDDL
ncbi:MAG: hypothetical protein RL497_3143, partial [Pseudomonadota bacterium]